MPNEKTTPTALKALVTEKALSAEVRSAFPCGVKIPSDGRGTLHEGHGN